MKTFIITLFDSELSVTLANECKAAAKEFGVDAELWPAVNGLTDGLNKLDEYGIPDFLIFKHALGVIGCFLSHFELWQYSVNNNESLTILEHDGKFIREMPKNVDSIFEDVLRLDPFKATDPIYDQRVIDSLEQDIGVFYPPSVGTHIAGEFATGSYCYCVKPHAAKKLMDFSMKHGGLPSDVHLGRDIVDLKATTATIVRLHEFYTETKIHSHSMTANLSKFLNN
jgi:hypothetical protein